MPHFDRKGPHGAGPMSGRAMGGCGGRHRHRGGRGFGAEAALPAEIAETAPEPTAEERRQILKAERNRLKSRLDEVEQTLRSIPPKPAGEPES